MIAEDFAYYRPGSLPEAARLFSELDHEGDHPLYYAGGTEILTQARLRNLGTRALIDLKGIPECRLCDRQDGRLILGSCLTLAEIAAQNPWPLLTETVGRLADHTTRRKITLGGNLAGTIHYREAALPFLLVDARARLYGPGGDRRASFDKVFDGTLQFGRGEFLVHLEVPEADLDLPGACVKTTRLDWVDYPLVTVAAVRSEDGYRVALSGLLDRPFRATGLEKALGSRHEGALSHLKKALGTLPKGVLEDLHGSADYRRFVLGHTLEDILSHI